MIDSLDLTGAAQYDEKITIWYVLTKYSKELTG
jgi:hypothetical protein